MRVPVRAFRRPSYRRGQLKETCMADAEECLKYKCWSILYRPITRKQGQCSLLYLLKTIRDRSATPTRGWRVSVSVALVSSASRLITRADRISSRNITPTIYLPNRIKCSSSSLFHLFIQSYYGHNSLARQRRTSIHISRRSFIFRSLRPLYAYIRTL